MNGLVIFNILFILYLVLSGNPACATTDGEKIYQHYCANCHATATEQAPDFTSLQLISANGILNTLVTGTMREVGNTLSSAEQLAVAEFIAGEKVNKAGQDLVYCEANPALGTDFMDGPHWNGWGVDKANTRFQPADMARLTRANIPRLKLKWAFGYPDETITPGQPSVIGGRLFVPSNSGNIYSLSANTGCAYWKFNADGPVRTAITIGQLSAGRNPRYAAYFTDMTANVYALNAVTGKLIWKRNVESHPAVRVSGAPQLYGGILYVPISTLESVTAVNPQYHCCTHRGSVVALDAENGTLVWKSYTIAETPKPVNKTNSHGTRFWGPSGAGIWSAPTIDPQGNVLYVATGENSSEPATNTSDAVIAMNLPDGKIKWIYQATRDDVWNAACLMEKRSNCPAPEGPDYDFGSSPVLVTLDTGHRILIAAQKSGLVHALDPDASGNLLWKARAGPGGLQGGVMWGTATDGDNIYVALSGRRGMMTENSDGTSRWELNPDTGGGLFAYRLDDGRLVWHAPARPCVHRNKCSPAQSAAVTVISGVVFSGSYDGYLRAFSTRDGAMLWSYDTVRKFDTVNSIPANGGALDGPGPVIVDGMMYVNSGYGRWGGMPGNVLLAFAVE